MKNAQNNTYMLIDSMGRNIKDIFIIASNVAAARVEAEKIAKEKRISYWKVLRAYSGGVRG